MLDKPLVSIVMPSLNQAEFIAESIESVLKQSYNNLELIVSDGASDDNTVSILKQYQAKDKRLCWYSEKDNGPADAINKALKKARGSLIGWLNSDDLYTEDAVYNAVNAFAHNDHCLMCYGKGKHVDRVGNDLDLYPTLTPDNGIEQFKEGCFICQPTVFFKYSMYALLGNLDNNLKTSFDFEYWLRAFSRFPERIGYIDRIQACSRLYDECLTMNMRSTVTIEGMMLLAKYLDYAPRFWLLTYINEVLKDDKTEKCCEKIVETTQKTINFMSDKERFKFKMAVLKNKDLQQHCSGFSSKDFGLNV